MGGTSTATAGVAVAASPAKPASTSARRRADRLLPVDRLLPRLLLGIGALYLALLALRLPDLIAWLNTSADATGAFRLADAVGRGDTGPVAVGTQGAWLALAFGIATRGLPLHRILWEVSPLALAWISAGLLGRTVATLAGRLAGIVCALLLVAAAPVALTLDASPWMHNVTLPAVVLLDAWLVWLHRARRPTRSIAASAAGLTALVGVAAASDWMVLTVALIPLALTAVLTVRRADRRPALAALMIAAGSTLVAEMTSRLMASLGLHTVSPPLHLAPAQAGRHLVWLLAGLLRLGGGIPGVAEPAAVAPVAAAAAAVILVAVIVAGRLGAAGLASLRRSAPADRARAVHVAFWTGAALGAAIPYVLAAEVVSDRYIALLLPAVAAIVPLSIAEGRRARRIVLAGSCVVAAASLAALAGNGYPMPRAGVVAEADRIAQIVHRDHLGVGFAGYWDAAPLAWHEDGRLAVAPVSEATGRVRASRIAEVAAWYRVHAGSPSYLILAPGDAELGDQVPSGWPRPARLIHVGSVTIAAWRFDIARLIAPPLD